MTDLERWDRARTLMLESLYKPDHQLRSCAFNQECKDELLEIRDQVVEMVREMENPHTPPLEFGKKNDPNKAPFSSDINLTLVILACALLVLPLKIIPFLINPLNVPNTCCCKDPVSTFKIVLVAE